MHERDRQKCSEMCCNYRPSQRHDRKARGEKENERQHTRQEQPSRCCRCEDNRPRQRKAMRNRHVPCFERANRTEHQAHASDRKSGQRRWPPRGYCRLNVGRRDARQSRPAGIIVGIANITDDARVDCASGSFTVRRMSPTLDFASNDTSVGDEAATLTIDNVPYCSKSCA